MKKQALILWLFLAMLHAGSVIAGEIKEIELTDGTVLTGEVLSLTNGVYTIRTGSLGSLKVDDAKVRAIRPRGALSSPPQGGGSGDVRALQDKMMADREVMALVESLKDDPQFRSALEDPDVMNAVNKGDVAALMANPRFLQLLNNPAVQDIQQKVSK
jgi:hypothetical protein